MDKKFFCPYCGCGCSLDFQVSQSSIVKTLQDTDDPVSCGKSCIKGLTVHEVMRTKRLTHPMVRPVKSRGLIECSWKRAYRTIASKLKELEEYDDNGVRDLIFFVPDGQGTNEVSLMLSKLCRSVYKSNNIDSCARLCHQATTVAFEKIYGLDAIPKYCIDDLKQADCFLMVGTDPAEDYPVMFDRIIEAKRNGAKIITLDVIETDTTSNSDIKLKVGSDYIIPFLTHLISRFYATNKISRDVKLFHGYQDFIDSAKKVSQEVPLSSLGISEEDFDLVYDTIEKSRMLAICFGMGLTQYSNGTQNAMALIGFGAMLNAIVFPNRGKVNIQGVSDTGGTPDWDSDLIDSDKTWNKDFRKHKGKILTEALYDDEIKFLWIVGGDLAQSLPDLNFLEESLRHKFIVYQGHHPCRLMDFASVVLPSAMLPEEKGSVTNGERRVRGIYDDSFSLVPEGVKTGLEILTEFSKVAGLDVFDYKSEKEIMEEIIRIVPAYNRVSFKKVCTSQGSFADKSIKTRNLYKIKYDFEHFQGEGNYPFVLTTARSKYHFCTGNQSRYSRALMQMSPKPLVFMNPVDMEYIGVGDGQEIRIISHVGEVETNVYKNVDVMRRMIVAQYHFPRLLINRLTPRVLDPQSGTPSYKEVPVKIEILI